MLQERIAETLLEHIGGKRLDSYIEKSIIDYIKDSIYSHDSDLSLKALIEIVEWRIQNKIDSYLNNENVPAQFKSDPLIFYRNRDKTGRTIGYYFKKSYLNNFDEFKKYLYFILESGRVAIKPMMDFTVVDFSLAPILLDIAFKYYPGYVNQVFIIDMPWILNGVWNLVKKMLPDNFQKKINFVKKNELELYIEKENILSSSFGGLDSFLFSFDTCECFIKPYTLHDTSINEEIESSSRDSLYFDAMSNVSDEVPNDDKDTNEAHELLCPEVSR
ncbi:CRAL/TRIO domain-containing protein, partial [Rozella allomycis CSF55]